MDKSCSFFFIVWEIACCTIENTSQGSYTGIMLSEQSAVGRKFCFAECFFIV